MIVIKDYKLPSQNTINNMHWTKKAQLNTETKWLLKEALQDYDGLIGWDKPITLEFKIYIKDKRKHDVDNCYVKNLIDGLVDNGIITDDDDRYVNRIVKEIIRSNEEKVEIRIK